MVFIKCKKHGEQRGYIYKNKAPRCVKCSSERVQKRRLKLKDLAVEYKGGCCQHCGYKKSYRALHFHHLDPSQKDFHPSKNGNTRSWEVLKKELDKCILLCSNCHCEEHDRLLELIKE